MSSPPQPLVPGPWKPLTNGEAAAVIARLDEHMEAAGLGGAPFSRQVRLHSLHAVPLSFYPGWLVVTAQADLRDAMVGTVDVLWGPGFFWCLDGRSRLIHELNAGKLPAPDDANSDRPSRPGSDTQRHIPSPLADLEPEHAGPDYLQFFCHAVRSAEGAFRVVQTSDDLRGCGVPESKAEELAPKLRTLQMHQETDADVARRQAKANGDGAPQIDPAEPALAAKATVYHGGALFDTSFLVDRRGMVYMLGDDMLADGIGPTELTSNWLRHIRPRPDQTQNSGPP